MKKITLLTAACLGISAMFAQTQRTILYEEFTGENCTPCAQTNPGLTALIHTPGNFPTKILLVRYQSPIPSAPGVGSLYQDDPTEVNNKITYYSVPFAPYARFNGIVLPYPGNPTDDGHAALLSQQYMNDSAIVNAPFGLNIVYGFNNTQDSLTVTATITAAMAYNAMSAGSLKFQLALEEAAIHFTTAPGNNGEKDFYDVMRKMIPNDAGTVLNNAWTNGAQQVITQKIAIPTYIKNKNQIAFVGWVQDDGSKRVHNAAYGQLNVDAGALGLGTNASCGTTFAPSVTVKNWGTTSITSYSLTYSIDGAANTTIAGTGTPLAAGATTNVLLPSQTFALGTHTVMGKTSMPNGSPDMFVGNDSITADFYVFAAAIPAPIVQGFESGTFPPTSWGIINGGNQAYTWVSGAYGGYQASATSAYLDLWDSPAGDIDQLVMPAMDLSTFVGAQLSFDISKGRIPGQADELQIVVSTDCGVTWTTVYDKNDNNGLATAVDSTAAFFPSAANQWRTDVVNMNAYAGQANVLVKFVAISAYSQNLFLDNINLASTTGIKTVTNATNLSVYPNPATSEVNLAMNLTKSENVTINIYNSLGALVYSETKNNMPIGDSNFTISTANLSSGIYNITVSSKQEFTTRKLTITK